MKKITTLLVVIVFLNVHAKCISQNITYSAKNVTLETVLSEVTKQTGYVFMYSEQMVRISKPVSVNATHLPLKDFLNEVFIDQPLGYNMKGKNIFISVKPLMSSANSDPGLLLNDVEILRIKVVDDKGNPLSGASIAIRSTRFSGVTGADGFLRIHVHVGDLLEVSFIGFEKKQVVISSQTLLSDELQVQLKRADLQMDIVQIIGYGTTTRRLSTGTSTTISSDVISKQPVTNLLEALSGRVSGLFISQSSGMPGAGLNVLIRGQNSIGAGNQPLYIIDGIPFTGSPIDQMGGSYFVSPNGGNSPFNTLSPSDIESISVLKDADATAIYGSRGSNGVILINTKKGSRGKTKFGMNVSTGASRVTRTLPMLNTAQYLDMRRKAFENDGMLPDISSAPDLTLWPQDKYTNWQDFLIGNTANVLDAGANLSGGNNQTSFLFSVNYHRETTVFPGDFNYKRASFHLNVDHTSSNNKFNFSTSVLYTKDLNRLLGGDLTSMYNVPPNFPLYDANGKLNWEGNVWNPLSSLLMPYEAKSNNFIGRAMVKYTLLPGLDIKSSFGYSRIDINQTQFYPVAAQNPAYNPVSFANFSGNYVENIILEPQADYRKSFGLHQFTTTVGATYQQSSFVQPFMISADNFSSDVLINNVGAAGLYSSVVNSDRKYKYASGFGRLNYVYDNKYLVSFSYRRDGSSRFGPGKQIGNFGSVSGGWIFSESEFIKSRFSWLSHGKLKASYGSVGNDQISDYGFLATYRITNYNYGPNSGLIPSRVSNPDYSWELTNKMEMTLDVGLFDERIALVVNAFRNRTNNMLVDYPLSPQSGFSSYQANLPALVQNSGLEVELTTSNFKSNDFSWSSSFNITFPKNKLVNFPGLSENSSYANTYVVGQPLSLIALYKYAGEKNGLPSVEDINKDGTISQGLSDNGNGDFIIAGRTAPYFYGGFNNSLVFKGWQLDVFFQFVKQKALGVRYYNSNVYFGGFGDNVPGTMVNQDDKPFPPGFQPTATIGSDAFNTYHDLYTLSDEMLSDASYIRLKNISLSYTFPSKLMEKAGISDLKLYLSGQNLLTVTNYAGFDPETQGIALPPLKNLTIGIKCSF